MTSPASDITRDIIAWYDAAARDLPWRSSEATPWGILVSEIMLQQTQVDRVLPVWLSWMQRWPTPDALAAAPAHEVIVAWGRLGYPRRALRLHQTAAAIASEHGGTVPADIETLESLPGIGSYTARAVSVFAHHQRHAVVDTNVRRVVARVRNGEAQAGPPRLKRDLAETEELLPADPEKARTASYAIMEFGAVICTAAAPKCDSCPIRQHCAWAQAGFPTYEGPTQPKQAAYAGSLREARGAILSVFRASPGADFSAAELINPIHNERWQRALQSLLRDGLIVEIPAPHSTEDSRYRLP